MKHLDKMFTSLVYLLKQQLSFPPEKLVKASLQFYIYLPVAPMLSECVLKITL